MDTADRIAAALIVFTVVSLISTLYLWSVWFRSRVRAIFYLVVSITATLTVLGSLIILVPAYLVLVDAQHVDPELRLWLVGVGLLLTYASPPLKAIYVYWLRNHRARRHRK